eukprot:CAMPEP_0117757958 /NCGR_PEP_ID=MMETSP0947-20121206/15074_1 /TAXON_ID=44440 /ORGANISM="Chattonella subsalsa, Strain CCMP2191" /LENGTH=112 /DNA_ID=CAMNT_0005578017 /DNA_START=263 /DNA_END=601 /DNA_ORIENTATION=-
MMSIRGSDTSSLGLDIEGTGDWLSQEVLTRLNDAFIPLQIHQEVAEKAKEVYMKIRRKGLLKQEAVEITDIVAELAGDLEAVDTSEAFLGPWDLATFACNILIEKIENDAKK